MAISTAKAKAKQNFSGEIDNTINPKRKVGRPKKEKSKKITISIPEKYIEGIEIGSALFTRGNVTAYICKLIAKDQEENLEKYKEFKKLVDMD